MLRISRREEVKPVAWLYIVVSFIGLGQHAGPFEGTKMIGLALVLLEKEGQKKVEGG